MKAKKILSLLLALSLMLVAFVIPAAAAGDGTITITNAKDGEKYDAYRVLNVAITTKPDSTKLYDYTFNDDFKPFFTNKGLATAAATVAYLEGLTATQLETLAKEIKAFALASSVTPATATAASGTAKFENLDLGYYLVFPQAGGANGLCNLTTTDPDQDIEVKSDYPDIEKNIVEGQQKVKAGDYAIGEDVTYELTSAVPDMTGYNKYFFIVRDTMSPGLSFNNDVQIKVGTKTLVKGTDFYLEVDPPVYSDVDGTKIVIIFKNFKQYTTGDAITITYTAELNDNAVIGNPGNPNEVYLEYSNDPHHNYTGTDKPDPEDPTDETEKDKTTVFTFELEGTKVDAADSAPLSGVIFSLWTETAITGAETKVYEGKTLYLVARETTDSDGKFSMNVKQGTYYLFEDQAKEGYNPMGEPIIFEVTAAIDQDTQQVTSLTVDNIKLRATTETGIIDTTIQNKKGSLLPETGGIGTTIFTITGIVLMIGAAIAFFLLRKKKRV